MGHMPGQVGPATTLPGGVAPILASRVYGICQPLRAAQHLATAAPALGTSALGTALAAPALGPALATAPSS